MKTLAIEPTLTDLPAAALMLLIIAALNYDTESNHRGWGYQYIGEGITVEGTHYSVSEVRLDDDGQVIMGVALTVRETFWNNAPEKPYTSYMYPLAELRRLSVMLPLVVVAQ